MAVGFKIADAFVEVNADTAGLGSSVQSGVQAHQGVFSRMGTIAGGILGAQFITQVGTAIKNGLGFAVTSASDLNEAMSKTDVIFGSSSSTIHAWARDAVSSMGLTTGAAENAAGGLGNIFTQMGFGIDQAAAMSQGWIQMAADIGSFNNMSTSEIIDMQTAALRGEYDSLQRVFPAIDSTRIAQQAMAETGKTSTDMLTDQEKALALQTLMMQDGANATGDFARTQDGLANGMRIASSGVQDLATRFGAVLLPAISGVVAKFNNEGLPVLSAFADTIGERVAPMVDRFVSWLDRVDFTAMSEGSGIFSSIRAVLAPIIPILQGMAPAFESVGDALRMIGAAIGDVLMAVLPAIVPVITIIAGLFAELAPVIASVAAVVAQALAGAITDLLPTIILFARVIADSFVQLLPAVVPIIQMLGQVIIALLPSVMSIVQALMPMIPILLDIANAIINALMPILPILTGLFLQLVPVVVTVIDALLPLIPPILEVVQAFMPLIPLLGEIIATILPPLIELFMALMPVLMQVIDILVAILVPAIQLVAGMITWWVESVMVPFHTFLSEVIGGVITWLSEHITSTFTNVSAFWTGVWNDIKTVVSTIWDWISSKVSTTVNAVSSVMSSVMGTVSGAWSTAWNGIKDSFTTVVDGIRTAWEEIMSFFSGIPSQISSTFSSVGTGISDAFKTAFNAVARFWNNGPGKIGFSIPDWVPGVGGNSWSIPDIPLLAKGGHITGSGAVMVGEHGPEILNLSQGASVVPLRAQDGGIGGVGGGTVIRIEKVVLDASNIKDLSDLIDMFENLAQTARTGREVTV